MSSDVACMAFPILVLLTSSCSPTIMTTDTPMFRMVLEGSARSPQCRVPKSIRVGTEIGLDENRIINRFWRKMLTPRAVISREMRAALWTSRR